MRISDIVLIINGTRNFDEMRRYFLEAIRFLVAYEKAMFYVVDMNGAKITLRDPVFVNVSSSFARDYEASIDNTMYGTVAINTRRSIAYRDTDILPDAVRINSDVYNTFLLPNGIPYGGGILIADGSVIEAEITLFRTRAQGDFTPKEVHILDILKQHLELFFRRRSEPVVDNTDDLSDRNLLFIRLGLTAREAEIAECIVGGHDTAAIAASLAISVFTVKKHVHNVFVKLNVKRRRELIDLVASNSTHYASQATTARKV